MSRKIARRTLGVGALGVAGYAAGARSLKYLSFDAQVNSPRRYPVSQAAKPLICRVYHDQALGNIDKRIFGTNLEWFNNAGGFASPDAAIRTDLTRLARAQGVSVMRFPGGTLADYYHWRDGIGPVASRPPRHHPTDSGSSANNFGSPEFFALLRDSGAEGLITVNAGTATASEAAAWVAYANQPMNTLRTADGWPSPAGIKLWEIGNELYLPGNPGDIKITQTPETYARNFRDFAAAMRAVDPSITLIATAEAKSHDGPAGPYPGWTETLLQAAAPDIDMVAVHNAYFPLLYNVSQPPVNIVYPALWAAPEAVARSLAALDAQITRHEGPRSIGIAVTEWGALFSMPTIDPYWFDHVKTLGSGVYIARLLQVFMTQPRMKLANYFKFTDRSFMGWVDLKGRPKVPYWVLKLFATASGTLRVNATVDSPTYDAPAVGVLPAQPGVAEVTVMATRDAAAGTLYVNFVNRSLATAHRIELRLPGGQISAGGEIRSISAAEPTAHNGVDTPPEWPMKAAYEPYSSSPPGSIGIVSRPWAAGDLIDLPPFSVATLIAVQATS